MGVHGIATNPPPPTDYPPNQPPQKINQPPTPNPKQRRLLQGADRHGRGRARDRHPRGGLGHPVPPLRRLRLLRAPVGADGPVSSDMCVCVFILYVVGVGADGERAWDGRSIHTTHATSTQAIESHTLKHTYTRAHALTTHTHHHTTQRGAGGHLGGDLLGAGVVQAPPPGERHQREWIFVLSGVNVFVW